MPEIGDHSEIAVPGRTPAVHCDQNPLRILAGDPVADDLNTVVSGYYDRFVLGILKLFGLSLKGVDES